jgi:signal recognition particle subunit SRP54
MLREVRMALLEADVALPVVRDFIARVKEKALGQEVVGSLTPGQALVGIVNRELAATMGDGVADINLAAQPPAVILMAGLQGAGKTTTTAKLAKHLIEKRKKKVLTVSGDVYRPAAIEQLKTVTAQAGAEWFPSTPDQKPLDIARAALDYARKHYFDVLLVDTAGRLAIDEALMREIQELHAVLNPVETLFVVDAMQGQDAVNTAKAFKEALPLTGIILTKMDGDSRGGAALSVRQVTGAPIKFAGVSEKIDGLEVFDAERHAGRILGMGDIVALVEQVTAGVDMAAAQKLAAKVKSGEGFDLNDFLDQIRQMKQMGGLSSLMDKLPGNLAAKASEADLNRAEKDIKRKEGIICSMTPGRAPQARDHQGHPQAPHRRRCRRACAGGQPPAQGVRADAGHDEEDEGRRPDEDDEAHGRHEGHAQAARHGLTEVKPAASGARPILAAHVDGPEPVDGVGCVCGGLWLRPWRMLRGPLLTPALAALVLLPWLWLLPQKMPQGLQIQLSGACLLVLMLGWPLAVLVLAAGGRAGVGAGQAACRAGAVAVGVDRAGAGHAGAGHWAGCGAGCRPTPSSTPWAAASGHRRGGVSVRCADGAAAPLAGATAPGAGPGGALAHGLGRRLPDRHVRGHLRGLCAAVAGHLVGRALPAPPGG